MVLAPSWPLCGKDAIHTQSFRGARERELWCAIAHLRTSRFRGWCSAHHPGMTVTKKPLAGLFRFQQFRKAQCASAHTFFLVKYIIPAKMIRNTKTTSPVCLRVSNFGSAAHIKNVAISCAYCWTVAGEPSSKVTCPLAKGCGILMAWPGKYLL